MKVGMGLQFVIFCKHFHEDVKDRMRRDAFPDGILPEKVTWKNTECANGIKYENMNGSQEDFVPEPGSLLKKNAPDLMKPKRIKV